jgi:SMC interacting uncharacterized protein involved in chromosome segregation
MDYMTMRLRNDVQALEKAQAQLTDNAKHVNRNIQILDEKVNAIAKDNVKIVQYVGRLNDITTDMVNRDDSLDDRIQELYSAISTMHLRIDQLEQAPSVTKRRRRVTICAS